MKSQLGTIALDAIIAIAPVVMALLGLLATQLSRYVNAKVTNTKLAGILTRLDSLALTVVQEVEQTIVSKLDPTKPLADNGQTALAAAITSLKTHLGQKGLDEVKGVLGIGDSDLDKVLVSYVESKVHVVNQAQQAIVQTQPGTTGGGAA
jgi:hypothetical protein